MNILTETCPLCRRVQYLSSGEFGEFLDHYAVDLYAGETVCLASGLSLEEAQSLANRLRKAAHP